MTPEILNNMSSFWEKIKALKADVLDADIPGSTKGKLALRLQQAMDVIDNDIDIYYEAKTREEESLGLTPN